MNISGFYILDQVACKITKNFIFWSLHFICNKAIGITFSQQSIGGKLFTINSLPRRLCCEMLALLFQFFFTQFIEYISLVMIHLGLLPWGFSVRAKSNSLSEYHVLGQESILSIRDTWQFSFKL